MKICPKSKRSRMLHRLRQCWSHISSSYRYVHLGTGQWERKRGRKGRGGKRESSCRCCCWCLLSLAGSCQRTVKTEIRWTLNAINSYKMKTERKSVHVYTKWYEVVKRRGVPEPTYLLTFSRIHPRVKTRTLTIMRVETPRNHQRQRSLRNIAFRHGCSS